MSTITVSTTLTAKTCPSCGGVYALSQEFLDEAHRIGGFQKMFCCPYCHEKRGWGENQDEKEKRELREQVARQTRRAEYEEQQRKAVQELAERLRHSRDGIRGVLTKERKRVGVGVCPCCNRTFKQLAAHMADKHPQHKNYPPDK